MDEKIKKFAEIVEAQELAALIRLCGSTRGNETSYLASIVPKVKYILVNVGQSGRYVIEKQTERVYGSKGYGRINKRHLFGTLDDIINRGSCARHLVG